MEDILGSGNMTKEEVDRRIYERDLRELVVSHARSEVVRGQLVRAYETLESIRFDFLGDTAFRDKVVKSKQGIESALTDFLLDDEYWKNRIKELRGMTPEEYKKLRDVKLNTAGVGCQRES